MMVIVISILYLLGFLGFLLSFISNPIDPIVCETLVIDDLKYLNVGKINPLGKGL